MRSWATRAFGEVAASTASIRPDAAIVIVGESSEHALDLIGRIVTEAACPVIAILDVEDKAFIRDAAKRGIFAYITLGRDASALQSSLDPGFVSARKDTHASGRNTVPSRIHADRARAVGRCDRHRLDSSRFPASRGRGSGSHPW